MLEVPRSTTPEAPVVSNAVNPSWVACDPAAERELLQMVAAHSADITVMLSQDGSVEWTSRPLGLWAAGPVSSLHGTAPWDRVHPDDLAAAAGTLQRILKHGESGNPVLIRILGNDGVHHWVEASGRLLPVVGVHKAVVQFRDVDREMKVVTALRESEERFRTLADNATDVVYTMDTSGVITWVSPSCHEILGWAQHEMVGHSVVEFVHPDDIAADVAKLRALIDAGAERGQVMARYLTRGGEWLWVGITGRIIRDSSGTPVAGIESLRDVSSEVLARQALAEAASHDPLTGLGNRAALVDEIRRALSASARSERPSAVLLLDLDHFKFVNDSMGHATGDQLIRQAGARIRGAVREADFVARQGGDEFVVVMRELDDATEALRVGQRLVEAFRPSFFVGAAEIRATASIGVSVSRGSVDVDAILAEADTAMYVAKEEGRDRVSLFNEELRAAVTDRLHVENGLRHAVEHGEFDVWYQPEVDVRTGEVCAVEALLRWNHPDGAMHPAAAFISVAEESGLIVEIGRMVIAAACAHAARWACLRPEPALTVRVNLSTRQLAEADLMATIDHALAAAGLDASLLCFEITESAILREIPTVLDNLDSIHGRGIRLAVDDFGTGYASLTYLRQLPISVLKLDRSFVRNLATSDIDRRLVAGVIGLARNLDISVTAEGVEEPAQAALLSALGCNRAQGYLYAGAMPASDVDQWLLHGLDVAVDDVDGLAGVTVDRNR